MNKTNRRTFNTSTLATALSVLTFGLWKPKAQVARFTHPREFEFEGMSCPCWMLVLGEGEVHKILWEKGTRIDIRDGMVYVTKDNVSPYEWKMNVPMFGCVRRTAPFPASRVTWNRPGRFCGDFYVEFWPMPKGWRSHGRKVDEQGQADIPMLGLFVV